jgi:hypothetical protein
MRESLLFHQPFGNGRDGEGLKTDRLAPGEDGRQKEPRMIGEQNDHGMKGRLLQCLQEDIRHMRSHAIGSSKDANAAPSFIGPVGQIFLHLSDLIDFKRLRLRFDYEDVRMQMAIDLFTGKAMIAGLSLLYLPFSAVEGLCKLEGDPLLSNSFIPQEQITMDHFIVLNRPPEQFHRHRMSDHVFKGHGFSSKRVLSSEYFLKGILNSVYSERRTKLLQTLK